MDFLRGLQTLDLCSNKLKNVDLKDLGNLELLYLRHNQLTRLPKLTSCVNIKELQLGNNFIQVLFLWILNKTFLSEHGLIIF